MARSNSKDKQKVRVRRADVASEAGVSSAAVSYVLNGTKRLSPEVEARVLDAARRLNYYPNGSQSAAEEKERSRTIVFLTNDIRNVYQLDTIKGMQEAAAKEGYVVYILDAYGNLDNCIDSLLKQNIAGIYVSGAPDFLKDSHLCKLRDAGIKVLADFSRSTYLPDVSYIQSDMYDGFMQAVNYLKDLGHTRVGYLSAFDEACYYDVRLPAFKIAMRKLLNPDRFDIEYGGHPYTSSEKLGSFLMERMMRLHPDVTAVIATNDLMAIGAMKAVMKEGKRVPEDYSVIGIDNIEQGRNFTPVLTTLDQNGRLMGERFFRVLLDNIENNVTGKYLEPIKLLKNQSVSVAPNRASEEALELDEA
jgi:DNA-binding LacI/PurR family transcriptional regulator